MATDEDAPCRGLVPSSRKHFHRRCSCPELHNQRPFAAQCAAESRARVGLSPECLRDRRRTNDLHGLSQTSMGIGSAGQELPKALLQSIPVLELWRCAETAE